MFAGGKLGQGVAIEPTVGKLVAPADGKVTVTFPSHHAYAIRTKDPAVGNIDILMHIGFDTVNLKGEHFTSHVNKGDEVKRGDVLAEFDIDAIKAAGLPVTTPVVVSNSRRPARYSYRGLPPRRAHWLRHRYLHRGPQARRSTGTDSLAGFRSRVLVCISESKRWALEPIILGPSH